MTWKTEGSDISADQRALEGEATRGVEVLKAIYGRDRVMRSETYLSSGGPASAAETFLR